MSEKVKPGQEEGPDQHCLPVVQVLGPPEVCEVPMVIQDFYGVSGSFQNVSPLFQASDDETGVLCHVSRSSSRHWKEFLDVNPTGCHLSSLHNWDRTASRGISGSNQSLIGNTHLGQVVQGWGVEVMSCLSSSKAFCLSSAHFHASPFLVSLVRGFGYVQEVLDDHW